MKMGGVNNWLNEGELESCFMAGVRNDTIVLGADVTHPSAVSKPGCPSIACVVGTINNKFMKHLGSMRLQAGGQEEISGMRSMVAERLMAWKKNNNGVLPKKILMYRDGVSESQLDSVTEYECDQIKAAFRSAGGTPTKNQPKITFIVVNKRHNTRFYPTTEAQTYKSKENIGDKVVEFLNGNLRPGLLVDDVVTNPGTNRNFFLQSHCAIKGTARSAHYHVTRDDMLLGHRIPNLTMKLCYTFGRSTAGVSYAAPAYIADRLCERGRAYLRHWIENSEMGPHFEMEPLIENGVEKPATEDHIRSEKKRFAKDLVKELWGKYTVDRNNRLNPWHPNFDDKMFWM